MAKSRTWKAAGLVVAAAVCTAGLIGAPASAGPTPATGAFRSSSPQPGGTGGYEQPAVDFLMHRYQVDAPEARRRLDDDLKVERLHDYVQAQFGSTYSGVWIDQADGGRVKVAAPSNVAIDTADLGRRFGLDGQVDRVVSQYDAGQLAAAKAAFARHLRARNARNAQVTAIDTKTSKVEVVVADPSDAGYKNAKADQEQQYPDSVIERHDDGPGFRLNSCNATYHSCDPQLRGGVWGQDIGPPNANPHCSLAFLARTSGGTPYVLTAGHCVQAIGLYGSTWLAEFADGSGHQIGNAVNGEYDYNTDVGLLAINNPTGWGLNRLFVPEVGVTDSRV